MFICASIGLSPWGITPFKTSPGPSEAVRQRIQGFGPMAGNRRGRIPSVLVENPAVRQPIQNPFRAGRRAGAKCLTFPGGPSSAGAEGPGVRVESNRGRFEGNRNGWVSGPLGERGNGFRKLFDPRLGSIQTGCGLSVG